MKLQEYQNDTALPQQKLTIFQPTLYHIHAHGHCIQYFLQLTKATDKKLSDHMFTNLYTIYINPSPSIKQSYCTKVHSISLLSNWYVQKNYNISVAFEFLCIAFHQYKVQQMHMPVLYLWKYLHCVMTVLHSSSLFKYVMHSKHTVQSIHNGSVKTKSTAKWCHFEHYLAVLQVTTLWFKKCTPIIFSNNFNKC